MEQFFTSHSERTYSRLFTRHIVFLAFWFTNATVSIAQTNLITNGDFSAGNTGFTSQYFYSADLIPEGNYYVGDNPRSVHPGFCNLDAETLRSPGSLEGSRGNMLIGNAAGDASKKLWAQTISVTPNTNYSFSFWAISLADPVNSLEFSAFVNCTSIGSNVTASTTCDWTQYTMQFNSGSRSSIELSIRNLSLQPNGNDIALDDMQFYAESPATPYPSITAFVWKGYSTDWFDADNWGNCYLPTCADDITIPAGVANYPVISTNAHASGLASARKITIQAGASLSIAQDITLNVCGDFVNNGTLNSDNGATVSFNGTSNQEISIGGQFTNLQVNQSPGKVLTAQSNVTVIGILTLTSGILNTNAFEVNVTNSAQLSVIGQSAISYVHGNLRRAIQGTGTYDFPLGDATRYELIRMYVTADLGISNVLGFFVSSDAAGTNGLPINEAAYSFTDLGKGGYWHLMPNTTPVNGGVYDLEVFPKNIVCPDINTTLVKRTNSSANWSLAGSSQVTGNPYRRNGYSTFSEITLASGTPISLPVRLLTFSGAQQINGVNLRWSTTNEHNSASFAIERSSDTKTFTEIGRVNTNGETHSVSNYEFTDGHSSNGLMYYRLRMIDQDNAQQFSKVVAIEVKADQAAQAFTLYPNPSESQAVRLKTNYEGEVEITIHNHFGTQLSRQRMSIEADGTLLGSELPQGVYIVRMTTPTQTFQQKLVIR